MSDITIQSSLRVSKGEIDYQSRPRVFASAMDTERGPTPGEVSVPLGGKNVDLSALARPGVAFIQNRDPTNFVTLGVWDGARFFPLLEFLAGEGYAVRLSRYLSQEFVGTGTGTNADINFLRLQPDTAAVRVNVEAFNK